MPALNEYLYACGHALGDLGLYFAAAGATDSVTLPFLSVQSAGASVHRYDAAHIFNATSGQQRTVQRGSFTAATGLVRVDYNWTVPVVDNAIIITQLFPCLEQVSGQTSYRTLINRALSMLATPDELSLTIVPEQHTYSLSTYARWLDREERLGWPPSASGEPQSIILEPGPTNALHVPADWRRPHLKLDGPAPSLIVERPFVAGTSGTLLLRVMRPTDTLVNGTESAAALSAQTDTAVAAINDVVECFKLEAYTILQTQSTTAPAGEWASKVGPQLERCRQIKRFDESVWKSEQRSATGAAAAA